MSGRTVAPSSGLLHPKGVQGCETVFASLSCSSSQLPHPQHMRSLGQPLPEITSTGQVAALCSQPNQTPPPPTAPTNVITSEDRSACVVNITWTASTDVGSGVSGYNVYRGSTFLGSTTSPSFQDTSFSTPPNNYTYYVYAYDVAGNVSAYGTRFISLLNCVGFGLLQPHEPPFVPAGFSWSHSGNVAYLALLSKQARFVRLPLNSPAPPPETANTAGNEGAPTTDRASTEGQPERIENTSASPPSSVPPSATPSTTTGPAQPIAPGRNPGAAPTTKPSSASRKHIHLPRSFRSFSPPSVVTYTAAAYAARAGRSNSTGASALAAYASPAACPLKADLFSYNVNFNAPVLSLPGRTGLNLNLTLTYNSKDMWVGSGTTMFFNGESGWPAAGWHLGYGRVDGLYSGPDGFNHYYYIDPTGAVHDLRYNSGDGLYESTDSTYFDFNDSTGILRDSNGTQTTFALVGGTGGYVLPTQIKDRNGNYITINYTGTNQQISSIVDTLGRTTSFSYNGDGTLASISKSGFNGAARTWTFAYSSVTLAYSFASTLTVNGPSNGINAKTLSSLTYPNGTKLVFNYNGYDQLTEADLLSSNGTIRAKYLVAWQSTPPGGWTTSPVPSEIGNYDGSNTNYWTLSFGTYTTTVTDPTGVPQTTTFLETGGWDDGLPHQTQFGSPVLKTVGTTWANDGASINPRRTAVTTTLNDTGQVSQIQTSYTTYGNPNQVQEYDYGSGGAGPLLRTTAMTYVTTTSYISLHILNLPASVIVYDGSGTATSNTAFTYDVGSLVSASGASNHDDTNYNTGFTTRGLLTTTTQYTNPVTPSGPIAHNATFDMLGNRRTADVDCCNTEQFNFSSTTQYSQPDSIVRGSGGTTLTTSATYDSYTSLRASSTDENGQVTSFNYDVMDRQTSLTRPDTTVFSTSYDDTSASPGRTLTSPVTSTTSRVVTTTSNGLGKPTRTTVTDAGATVYSKVDTQYDALERVSQVSLPYTGASPSYWTQKQYDPLGRLLKVIPADGSASSNNIAYSYSGNAVTVTDPAGKQRKWKKDARRRTTEVDEPDPSNGNTLTLATTYSYSPLNRLTQIAQGSQTRNFGYDGLGRITSKSTPESGSVSYTLTNFGKVSSRTDARGVITNYSYDGINRLSQVSYNVGSTGVPATPTVSYAYGTNTALYNNGRMITMTDGLGTENYTYDKLGRKIQVQRTIYNVNYTTGYAYNLTSGVTQMTHPSGRVVKRSFDAIGRLQTLQNNSTSANYATSFGYNAARQLTGFTFGNGVTASYTYTAQRSQLSALTYAHSGTNVVSLSYGYTQNGGNNGQRTSITDGVDTGRTESLTYDSLNRLTAATTSGSTNYPAWALSWTYDRYGNRTAQTATVGSPPSNSTPVNSANQTTGIGSSTFTYDANGNLTKDDNYQYTYDAESRLVQVQPAAGGTAITTYAFDGQGRRSVKVAVGQSGSNRTFTLYAGAKIVSEFNDVSTATYTTGTTPHAAPTDSVSTLLYQHQDHLTTRATTDQFGNVATLKGHYPFGDSWYETGAAMGSVSRKFTRYMVEGELPNSVLHQSMYRQHSARIGRFQTPDRLRGNIFAPQRLNRYSYVRNDPVNRTDPKGLDDDGDSISSGDPFGPDPFSLVRDGGGGGSGDVIGDEGGNPIDPIDPLSGSGDGPVCDPTSEIGCGGPSTYCDPSTDVTCGNTGDPTDPANHNGLGLGAAGGGYKCFCFLATFWQRCKFGCEYICECDSPGSPFTTILTLPQWRESWAARCQEVIGFYCTYAPGPGNCKPTGPMCYEGD